MSEDEKAAAQAVLDKAAPLIAWHASFGGLVRPPDMLVTGETVKAIAEAAAALKAKLTA